MEKVIRDGKVAVLYSRGFGAGWYSWNSEPGLLFHPKLVEMVEQGKQLQITEELVKSLFPNIEYICVLGVDGLTIEWLPEGTPFRIDEYDGAESVITDKELYFVA